MPVSQLDVSTADGIMDVYLHAPAGGAPASAVIFFPDAAGVRAVMHEMAERLASAGYLVVLPNFFYRSGDYAPFDIASMFRDPAERQRLGAILELATVRAVMQDTGSLLDAVATRTDAEDLQFGAVGYCMGGRWAFAAAAAHPERIAAAASIHGGYLVTDAPDSPHLQADRIRGRIYLGVADNDASCTPENQAQLAAALDRAGVRYRLELYPGAGHGFAVPDHPDLPPGGRRAALDRGAVPVRRDLRRGLIHSRHRRRGTPSLADGAGRQPREPWSRCWARRLGATIRCRSC